MVLGVEKKIKVKRKKQAPGVSYATCKTCQGSGQTMRITNTYFGAYAICNNMFCL
jgi:molecular chaperone DnaJ